MKFIATLISFDLLSVSKSLCYVLLSKDYDYTPNNRVLIW